MIGDQIRKYRESQNISQSKLAELMGISRPVLSKIETNKKTIDRKLLMAASHALSIDYRILAAGELIQDDVLLGNSVERINQATERILDESSKLEKTCIEFQDSKFETKMRRIKLYLVIFFVIMVAIEIILLLIYHKHFS